jgi:hypothetical protein
MQLGLDDMLVLYMQDQYCYKDIWNGKVSRLDFFFYLKKTKI